VEQSFADADAAKALSLATVSTTLNEEVLSSLGGSAADALAGRSDPPAWIVPELPAEYGEIARKIEGLRQEARKYEQLADVLWRVGDPLTAAVRAVFEALEYTTVVPAPGTNYDLAVEIAPGQRLLVEVTGGTMPFDKRAAALGRAFRAIQEDAGPGDRVIIAANIPCDKPAQSRPDPPATPEALRLIQGLGANVVATPTLFGLWRFSLKDKASVRESIKRLHALDGGIFR
jgi:hypothetical protein